jgi:hypothetical protein
LKLGHELPLLFGSEVLDLSEQAACDARIERVHSYGSYRNQGLGGLLLLLSLRFPLGYIYVTIVSIVVPFLTGEVIVAILEIAETSRGH